MYTHTFTHTRIHTHTNRCLTPEVDISRANVTDLFPVFIVGAHDIDGVRLHLQIFTSIELNVSMFKYIYDMYIYICVYICMYSYKFVFIYNIYCLNCIYIVMTCFQFWCLCSRRPLRLLPPIDTYVDMNIYIYIHTCICSHTNMFSYKNIFKNLYSHSVDLFPSLCRCFSWYRLRWLSQKYQFIFIWIHILYKYVFILTYLHRLCISIHMYIRMNICMQINIYSWTWIPYAYNTHYTHICTGKGGGNLPGYRMCVTKNKMHMAQGIFIIFLTRSSQVFIRIYICIYIHIDWTYTCKDNIPHTYTYRDQGYVVTKKKNSFSKTSSSSAFLEAVKSSYVYTGTYIERIHV